MFEPIIILIIIVLCSFLFWRNMRRLGFDTRSVFDLLILTLGCGLVGGKLFPPPVFWPAALFFGLLAFFWYCNRQKWSVFEVGDQVALALLVGYLFRKSFRGLRLFLILIIISIALMISDRSSVLTFSLLTLVLSLVGIWQRLKKKIMFGTSEVIAKLKHRLLSRKEQLREQQLKLPQDDPFFEAGRANSNSPEEDENEQVGHRDVLAQARFLKDSAKQVDAALEKMDQGTYGVCEKCGATIEPARLEADPAATLCIKCAK